MPIAFIASFIASFIDSFIASFLEKSHYVNVDLPYRSIIFFHYRVGFAKRDNHIQNPVEAIAAQLES